MPSDYRNSLGYLGLQLKAQQLQQDQQRQYALEQYGREAQQQDIQNTLSFMQHHEQAKSASEDRKLQLAAMLQKAAEANQNRKDIQELKDRAAAPERESKVRKNEAQAKLAGVQAEDIPLDTKEAERSHRANEANTLRGQNMSLLGKDLAYDPVYGGRDEAAAQKAHDILGLGALTPPDPSIVRTPKSEVGKVFNDVRQGQNSEIDIDAALKGLESADPSDFGVRGSRLGFNMPIVGRVNPNTIQDLLGSAKKALGDESNPDSKATQRRALIEQSYGRQVANTIRYLSGLASSDQEAARIFAQFGVKPDDRGKIDIFGADLDTLKAAMGAAKEYIARKKANDVAVAQQGGVRIGELPAPVKPGPPTPPPSGPRQLPKDPMQRFRAILEANPGMSDEDAYRLATQPDADVGQ